MDEKLAEVEKRFEQIEAQLSDASVVADMEKYRQLMKDYKEMTPLVEKYRDLKKAESDLKEAEDLLAGGDPDLKELAEEQADESRAKSEALREELKEMLLPKDPDDDKNVIFEIRAGAGGEEAALFASVLYRMYHMYADTHRLTFDLIYCNDTELGGMKEVSFLIKGEGAYGRLKYESGVHRVQRVPETESQGRIQTSTATVAVLPESEEVAYELNMEDLEITTHKSSGAGGQHVNKTESAIRIIHKPTGLVVDCQNERSQLQNKEKAIAIMKARLAAMEQEKQNEEQHSRRRSQIGTGDRSERIRTYNYPQGRITDHRIGLSVYDLPGFLNGNLDDMIDALATADRAARLAASES
ncbi:MAG: peptide chain release factor 1 [Clostridia bacterium]|nr:peptide chain release factor 1 [Clostridia bacterium]